MTFRGSIAAKTCKGIELSTCLIQISRPPGDKRLLVQPVIRLTTFTTKWWKCILFFFPLYNTFPRYCIGKCLSEMPIIWEMARLLHAIPIHEEDILTDLPIDSMGIYGWLDLAYTACGSNNGLLHIIGEEESSTELKRQVILHTYIDEPNRPGDHRRGN